MWLIMNEADTDTAKKIHNRQRVVMLESCRDGQPMNVEKIQDQIPGTRITSTHLMPKFFKNLREGKDVPKIIILSRNPKDTLVSYYHFYRANAALGNFPGSFHDFFKLYEAKKLNHGDFFDHCIAWATHPLSDQFLFVKFEDMKEDLPREIKRICRFLNKTLPDDQMDRILKYSSFDEMKNNPMAQMTDNKNIDPKISPYVRKGKVGDWKSEMFVYESDVVDEACQNILHPLGIHFRYE